MKKIILDGRPIGNDEPAYIIAEISANHDHDLKMTMRMVRMAKECGADAVKLQTYTPDTMTLDSDSRYFRINKGPWKGQTLYELYKKAYMPWEWQRSLKKYADSIGITLFSTPFDKSAVDFLEKLKVPAYKIASFELVDIPLIRYAALKGRPVILSTGMASLEEIRLAVRTVRETGNDKIILLKCASSYPAKPEEMNLSAIRRLSDEFRAVAGLSDHSLKSDIALAAVCLGAKVIEKHFTLSRRTKGPDSAFSVEPGELKDLIRRIRDTEKAIGRPVFRMTREEKKSLIFRRSVFAVQDIKKGERLTEKNIRVIRPGSGMKPLYYQKILGKKAGKNIKAGTPLRKSHAQ